MLQPAYLISVADLGGHIVFYNETNINDTAALSSKFQQLVSHDNVIIMMKLLHAFDVICHQLQIHDWHLCYGTLLGQYIFHGKIPWDDDIDIIMNGIHEQKLLTHLDVFVHLNPEFGFHHYSGTVIKFYFEGKKT